MGDTNRSITHPAKRIWIFDNMRTRSHVFFQLFSQHPDLFRMYHPYLNAHWGPESLVRKVNASPEFLEESDWGGKQGYDDCNKLLTQEVKAAEDQGKVFVVNEHSFISMQHDILFNYVRGKEVHVDSKNPTYIPDWLFETLTPIIVVRHPALQIDSFYRAMRSVNSVMTPTKEPEALNVCSCQHLSRVLFDFFNAKGKRPVVVDGEDTIWRTEDLSRNVCEAVGIDPKGMTENWTPMTEEEIQRSHIPPHLFKAFLTAFHATSGVERPEKNPGPVNIDEMVQKWTARYGVEDAEQMRFLVKQNMPDYEYLIQFKS